MRLKALSNFWMMDKKRGVNVARKIGEEITVDESEEGELVYAMLTTGRGTVIDEKFIAMSGKYFCLHSFSYENVEGLQRFCSGGSEITLSQEVACRFLVSGHIKPIDDAGWTPKKLLGLVVKENTVKQMFDDMEQPKENWTMKGRNR